MRGRFAVYGSGSPVLLVCRYQRERIEWQKVEFFRLMRKQDVEGIVAKLKHAAYGEKWFTIRNPRYSQ